MLKKKCITKLQLFIDTQILYNQYNRFKICIMYLHHCPLQIQSVLALALKCSVIFKVFLCTLFYVPRYDFYSIYS